MNNAYICLSRDDLEDILLALTFSPRNAIVIAQLRAKIEDALRQLDDPEVKQYGTVGKSHSEEGVLEVDLDTVTISKDTDNNSGAYVMCWMWISKEELNEFAKKQVSHDS